MYLASNDLTGGLEPLRCCTGLKELFLASNHLTGGLEPLQSCPALQELVLDDNKLEGGIEHLKDVVINDKLKLNDEFEAQMQHIVDTYHDEWAEVVKVSKGVVALSVFRPISTPQTPTNPLSPT